MRLRIQVPDDWTDGEVCEGLSELVENLSPITKALKNPLPGIERANARRLFLGLQQDYRAHAQEVIGGLDDVSKTVHGVLQAEQVHPAAQGHLTDLLDRMHLRAQAQLRSSFSIAYRHAFELGLRGAGNGRGMARNEEAIVADSVENEMAYAKNFTTDVAWREGTLKYDKRADLYGNALEELYWLGYVYADLSRGRYIKWVMRHATGSGNWGEHESCIDCAWISGALDVLESDFNIDPAVAKAQGAGGRWGTGVYLAQELAQMAVTPQSGKLTCTTKCKCRLEPARKPLWRPRDRKFKPWRSQLPKDFTGTVQDETGKPVVTRKHKTARRKTYAAIAAATEHRHRKRV